jgi:hypothetical protein
MKLGWYLKGFVLKIAHNKSVGHVAKKAFQNKVTHSVNDERNVSTEKVTALQRRIYSTLMVLCIHRLQHYLIFALLHWVFGWVRTIKMMHSIGL